MKIVFIFLFSLISLANTNIANKHQFDQNNDEIKDTKVIQEYPELKKFLFKPPKNTFYLGLGIAPLGLMGSKYFMTLSPLQVHWKTKWLDWEILSVSLGRTFTSTEFAQSWNFSIRTAPKLQLFTLFENVQVSVGGIFGVEGIQYPDVEVVFQSPTPAAGGTIPITKRPVKLSATGTIIGGVLSQSINLDNGNIFQINQIFYQQKFNIKENDEDWIRVPKPDHAAAFNDPAIFKELEANTVMMIEFAYLY